MHTKQPWWRHGVVYQIYPRSFADSPRPDRLPGVGDIAGIAARLDHLAWLGVDALWLSPVFRSPMADFGYDVSDYCDIDPVFGDLAAMDTLIEAAHARNIRVLLDWVPNHTSNLHPWFQESRTDRTNPKADWYVWRDEPATNWNASFLDHRPAWTFDPRRGQYYLHCFLPEQPDLNWDHPEVEAAMHDTLRFWLDRGVDGFRMDVVHLIGKDYADDPADAVAKGWSHVTFNDVPVTHERLRRIRALLDAYPGHRTSVGEVYLLDEQQMATYHGTADAPELHLSFNFRFLWSAWEPGALAGLTRSTTAILQAHGAPATWALSNHDVPRHRGRYGGDELDARIAAVMLLMLPGTAFLYQGEELGLVDADVPASRQVDPGGRDGCRAPIPWDGGPLHGWRDDPWLPFPPEADVRNVAALATDPGSILHWYRRLIDLRRTMGDARAGTCTFLTGSPGLFAWSFRGPEDAADEWFVYVNPTADVQDDGGRMEGATVVACTDPSVEGATISQELPARVAFVAHRA